MQLLDVNVLVYAYATDAPNHADYRRWLEALLEGDEAFSVSDLVLSSFLRVVTHPRVFSPPSGVDGAIAFADEVRSQPHATSVSPGPRHWAIFVHLCGAAGAKGNLVPDAYLAALAIETGSEWITTDGDFGRLPRSPVAPPSARLTGNPAAFIELPAGVRARKVLRFVRGP